MISSLTRQSFFILFTAFVAALGFGLATHADPGDDLLKKLTIPPAPPLSPAEAIKSFKVAPGFRVELVAAEPLVSEPVAISFDPDGRLYVCEMRGYMPNIEGKGEQAPVGRIVVLEDTNGDGLMDKQTVFLDELVGPRAVCVFGDGVLVGAGNKLWFCRSTKSDLKCDEKILLGDYLTGNPEYGANGLLPALDNWIYSGNHGVRHRKLKGNWVKDSTVSRGQWGLGMDDDGRLYYNSNSSLLRGDLVPVYSLNAHLPSSVTNVQLYKEQDVWPARINPGINRYFHLRPDGKLKAVTAACGPAIYRGDLLPTDVRGNAFICEPAGNLIRRNILFQEKGKSTSRNAYDKAEFLASTDERFRPVNINNGPDGALYIVDLYHGILQHKGFMTPFLKNQIIDRKLDVPIGMGRIYRVVPETMTERPKMVALSKKTSEELVAFLADVNGWRRDTAQQMLVHRAEVSVIPALEKMVSSDKNPLGRLHALWTLEGLGKLDQEVVMGALADANSQVRASAVSLTRRLLRNPPDPDLLRELVSLGKDKDADVRLQLVFTLGLVNNPLAEKAIEPILKEAAANGAVLESLLGGFMGRETEFLSARLEQPAWATKEAWREKLLSSAAGYVYRQRNPLTFLRFFHLVGNQPKDAAWRQIAMLDGLKAPPVKNTKGAPPVRLMTLPTPSEGLNSLLKSADPKVKHSAEELAKQFNWPGKDGKPLPVPPPLSPEHTVLNEMGRKEYMTLCATCHHPLGVGIAGSGPPLLDSHWPRGSEDRLVRMVLHGMRDPITINKEVYNRDGSLSMPAMGISLDDQKIASILTFVRREWGDFAHPVEPTTVQKIRAATKSRTDPWTEPELLKVK